MNIKNSHLEYVVRTLNSLTLNITDSVARRKVLRALGPAQEDFNAIQNEVRLKYCKKKEDGTPDIKEGRYQFEAQDKIQALSELSELSNTVADVRTEGIEDYVVIIKGIFENELTKAKGDKESFTASEFDVIATLQEVIESF